MELSKMKKLLYLIYNISRKLHFLSNESQIDDSFKVAVDEIFEVISKVLNHSSMTLDKINFSYLNIHIFSPLKGSSYIEMPTYLLNKKAIINVKNNDEYCFLWAISSALIKVEKHAERTSNYTEKFNELKEQTNSLSFPLKICDIPKFRKLTGINVNVFSWDTIDNKPNIEYICKDIKTIDERSNIINLMLIEKMTEDKYHYVWIKNFSRLIGEDGKQKAYTCFNCLNYFGSEKLLHKHYEFDCSNFGEGCRVEFPEEENRFIEFTKYSTKLENPIIFYLDVESSLPKLNHTNKKDQMTIQESIHIPNSFGIYAHCRFDETLSDYYHFRAENDSQNVSEIMMEKIIELRDKYMKIINYRKKKHAEYHLTEKEQKLYNQQINDKNYCCHICEKKLTYKVHKELNKIEIEHLSPIMKKQYVNKPNSPVIDHCHLTGKFRGVAHSKCNAGFHKKIMIPVISHNMRGYDSKFIIQAFTKLEKINKAKKVEDPKSRDITISCIPQSKEKLLTFSFLNLRFIDSFSFMSSSLDSLVKNLGKAYDYKILNRFFPQFNKEQIKLITQKGVYPYEFIDSVNDFKKHNFHLVISFIHLNKKTITNSQYQYANNVWNKLGCQNLGDYHDIYLKSDVLLLLNALKISEQME